MRLPGCWAAWWEDSAAAPRFFSDCGWACLGQTQGCNTAQGDMGLLVSFPAGDFLGSVAALVGVRVFLGGYSRKKRMTMMALLLAVWGATMLLCAWMAR